MEYGRLLLSRRHGESVMIGDEILVTVKEGRSRGEATLEFVAPKDVPIHRKEIYDEIAAYHAARQSD